MMYLHDQSFLSIKSNKKHLKQYSIQFTDYFCNIRVMEAIKQTEKGDTVVKFRKSFVPKTWKRGMRAMNKFARLRKHVSLSQILKVTKECPIEILQRLSEKLASTLPKVCTVKKCQRSTLLTLYLKQFCCRPRGSGPPEKTENRDKADELPWLQRGKRKKKSTHKKNNPTKQTNKKQTHKKKPTPKKDQTQDKIIRLFASGILTRIRYWISWTIKISNWKNCHCKNIQVFEIQNSLWGEKKKKLFGNKLPALAGFDFQVKPSTDICQMWPKIFSIQQAVGDTLQKMQCTQQKPKASWNLSAWLVWGRGKRSTSFTDGPCYGSESKNSMANE